MGRFKIIEWRSRMVDQYIVVMLVIGSYIACFAYWGERSWKKYCIIAVLIIFELAYLSMILKDGMKD